MHHRGNRKVNGCPVFALPGQMLTVLEQPPGGVCSRAVWLLAINAPGKVLARQPVPLKGTDPARLPRIPPSRLQVPKPSWLGSVGSCKVVVPVISQPPISLASASESQRLLDSIWTRRRLSRRIPFPSQSLPRPRGGEVTSDRLSCVTVFMTATQHCHASVPTRWALGLDLAIGDGASAHRTSSRSFGLHAFGDGLPVVDFGLIHGEQIKNLRNPSEPETVKLSVCSSEYVDPETLKIP